MKQSVKKKNLKTRICPAVSCQSVTWLDSDTHGPSVLQSPLCAFQRKLQQSRQESAFVCSLRTVTLRYIATLKQP